MTDRGRSVSVRQAAERLGISQRAVTSLIALGELPAFNVSLRTASRPRWKILPEALEAFIARRTHKAAAPRRRRRKPSNVKQWF